VAQGLPHSRREVRQSAGAARNSGRSLATVIAQDLGFQAGPRLNAAGRLEDMTLGIDCLLTADPGEARELAARLSQLNSDRRVLEGRMQEEALLQVDRLVASLEGRLPAGLCLFDGGWHQGVVGLVASRVKEKLNRPVMRSHRGGRLVRIRRARCRGARPNVLDAIALVTGLLEVRAHAMAAGMAAKAARHSATFKGGGAASVAARCRATRTRTAHSGPAS
jgi:single-stranded-DNA-specific exonuclease